MLNGVDYLKIDDAGLHIRHQEQIIVIPADTIIVCAGQESERRLYDSLKDSMPSVELIGGAYKAAELDAKEAIKQASYSAANI